MTGKNAKQTGRAGNYIWNSIGGMLNAGQSVLILMVITRTCSLLAAGIFSIAFATGNLFMYLGNYGVRNYQVSDLSEECSFTDYLIHRFLVVFLMLVFSFAYTGWFFFSGRYSTDKTLIVLAMCLLKAVDCVEEVFEGRLHQKGRLDLAGKMMTFRLIVSVGGMILVLMLTGDLLSAVNTAFVLAVVSFAFIAYVFRKSIAFDRKTRPVFKDIAGIFRACFPVCAANFLSFYLVNAPKYAIDAIMDEAAQARYNFIAMPVFVIQLMNLFLYQPVLVRMTVEFNEKDRKSFIRDLRKIIGELLLISVVCLAGAWLIGIPVLSALYATDLSELKNELMLILVGGTFLALTGFLCAVLTIARKQKPIPVMYLLGTIVSLVLTYSMVRSAGIMGGVAAFVISMAFVAVLLGGMLVQTLRKL